MSVDEKQNGRFGPYVQRSASPLHSSIRATSVPKVALIVLALLSTEWSYAAIGNANTTSFSQKQITDFVKTVTTALELSRNGKSSLSNTTGSKLFCSSIVLGEGFRAGSHGLYTWFTCSAMHKLVISETARVNIACTGFSSPVWIEPKSNSVSFETVTSETDYVAFRNSAPAPVQILMDSNYRQVNSGKPRMLIARATSGSTSPTNSCQ